jgi:hypothetical protein
MLTFPFTDAPGKKSGGSTLACIALNRACATPSHHAHALSWADIAELTVNRLQAGVEAKAAKAQAKADKAAVKAASKGKAPAKKRKRGKKMPEPDPVRLLCLVSLTILLTPCKQITDEEDEDDSFQDADEDGQGGETDVEGDHDCGGRLV